MNSNLNPFLNRTGNLLLLLVGMESLFLLFCDSFKLSFSFQACLWLAVLCLLLWIAVSFRYGPVFALPLCALVLFFLFRQNDLSLIEAVQALADHVVGTYYEHFGGSHSAYTEEPGKEASALLLMLFLLSAFVSLALTSSSFRISLSRLATLPFFIACIIVNGTPPVLPIIGMLLFWLGLQLSGDSFRENDGAGKSLFLGMIPCILVLAGLLLLYRPSTYHYDERDIALSRHFDRIGNMLSNWAGGSGSPSVENGFSNLGGTVATEAPAGWNRDQDVLDLTSPFDYSELPITAMTFRTDASGTVYLRGRSYGEYIGTAWTAAVENKHGNALNYTAQSISGDPGREKHSFQLFTPTAYDILYLPYYTITGGSGDVSVPSEALTNYSGEFSRSSIDLARTRSESLLPTSLTQEEAQYREYVHSYYTRLPDSTRSELSLICRDEGFTADQEDILDKISSYVRSQGIYDLSVEAYPSSDYAVYFLTVSHRGYCIHYATAAAALFRALDLPARICEGYMINCIPDRDIRITGENAHAWVEVYRDGVGWIPVEVTASTADSSEFPEAGAGDLTSEVPETPPLSDDTSELPANSDADEASPDNDPGAEENGTSDDTDTVSLAEAEEDSHSGLLLHILLFLFGIPAIVAALLFGRYNWLRFRIKKQLTAADRNRKAVLLYRLASRVSAFGSDIPDTIRITAEKAAFSQHEITPEEYRLCSAALEQMTQETYSSLSKWKKFVFRFLYGNL